MAATSKKAAAGTKRQIETDLVRRTLNGDIGALIAFTDNIIP